MTPELSPTPVPAAVTDVRSPNTGSKPLFRWRTRRAGGFGADESADRTAEVAADLATGYAECARLTRAYGTTYYWGAVLLPGTQRRHVHAVYALCRLADDIVDAADATLVHAERTRIALADFRSGFEAAIAGRAPNPTLAAIAATVDECGIDLECFDRFFDAMAMDLDHTGYPTWDSLCGYMEGSAAVIGEMMLPVLQPLTPEAREPARALGFAFQLTNFLRDVGEDLDRGRVYLPQEDLDRFGASPRRGLDDAWRELMSFEIDRNRRLYATACEGVPMLPPRSARCVATALRLYSGILERIEARDYDVFSGRAAVPTWRKVATAAGVMVAGPRLEVA